MRRNFKRLALGALGAQLHRCAAKDVSILASPPAGSDGKSMPGEGIFCSATIARHPPRYILHGS